MSLIIRCPCGKRLKVDSSLSGKRVKCPACGQSVLAEEVDEVEEFVEVEEKKKKDKKKGYQRGFAEPARPRERKASRGRITFLGITLVGWLTGAATLAVVAAGTVILLPYVNPAFGKEPYWVLEDMGDHLQVTIHNTKVGPIEIKLPKRRSFSAPQEGNTERDGQTVTWKVESSRDAGITEVACDGKVVRKSPW